MRSLCARAQVPGNSLVRLPGRRALGEIGYRGSATVELPGGDEAYLREVSKRFDLILTGA